MLWHTYQTTRWHIISDSEYGHWRDYLSLPTTAEQDEACLFLEAQGHRFLIDYGFENAIAKAEGYPQFRQRGKA